MQKMYVDVDGTQVFVNTGGGTFDPDNPAAVMIHGAGCDHSIWGGQNRYLAHHGASVLALDLPGHGRTGGAPIRGIGAMADFVARFLEVREVARPVLIGHSMGSFVALELASRLGGKAAGLGLLGTAAAMPVHPALLAAAEANDLSAAQFIASWGHGARGHRGGNPVNGIWMMQTAIRMIDNMPDGTVHCGLASCAEYEGATAAAEKVQCPTLFVLGAGDKMTPRKAAQPLIDAIAGSEVTVIPNCGHMMMTEAPHDTRDALMNLIRKVTAKEAA